MIRRGILCEFLSQQSCDYAVDIFSFNLIFSPFFSFNFTPQGLCIFFSLWYLAVELQGAASSCAEVRYAAGSTYSSSHSGNNALFDLRDIVCQHKKCFTLHASCALTASWPEDLTCIQLHKLYIAQAGRGATAGLEIKPLHSERAESCNKTCSFHSKGFPELGSSSQMLKA